MKTPASAPANPVPALSEAQRQRVDAEMHADKLADGYAARNFQQAMELQIKHTVGSPL